MKRLAVVAGGVIAVVGIYFLFNSSEEVKNPLNENIPSNTVHKNIEKPVYKPQKVETKKVVSNEKRQYIPKPNTENVKTQKSAFINNEIRPKKEIENYLSRNNLVKVSSIDDKKIQIYAKNPPQKNDFAPPMPPVFVKLKFKNSEDIVAVNANLINSNKKLYVVKDEGKGAQIKEINTKDMTSFTPPSIGQN